MMAVYHLLGNQSLKLVIPLLSRTLPRAVVGHYRLPYHGRRFSVGCSPYYLTDHKNDTEHLKVTAEIQADEYDVLAVTQKEDGETLIRLITQSSPKKANRVTLDLGCGTGNLTPMLAKFAGEGGRVIGVDPDEARIKKALEKFEGKHSNVEFLKGSGESFPKGPYDLVFCNSVIHWIENKDLVFKKVHKNLQQGGQFAFSFVTVMAPFLIELQNMMPPDVAKEIEESFHLEPPEAYDVLATSHGFTTKHRDIFSRDVSFPHIDILLKWAFAATHGKIDPEKAKEKIERFKSQFGDDPVAGEWTTFVKARFILTKL